MVAFLLKHHASATRGRTLGAIRAPHHGVIMSEVWEACNSRGLQARMFKAAITND